MRIPPAPSPDPLHTTSNFGTGSSSSSGGSSGGSATTTTTTTTTTSSSSGCVSGTHRAGGR